MGNAGGDPSDQGHLLHSDDQLLLLLQLFAGFGNTVEFNLQFVVQRGPLNGKGDRETEMSPANAYLRR